MEPLTEVQQAIIDILADGPPDGMHEDEIKHILATDPKYKKAHELSILEDMWDRS